MTYKRFIAAVMAAAIAITAFAPAQARAGNDTARIIAGVAALALVSAAIAEASRDRNVYVTRNGYQPYPTPRVRHHRHHRHNRYCDHRGYRRHNQYRGNW